MGAGSPQEAEYTLVGDLPAGEWLLVADGIIIQSVDVTFDLLVRHAAGGETMIATFQHHFDPLPSGFSAQPYEARTMAPAIAAEPGDQLIFRYAGANTTLPMAYIPNGDGFRTMGRIPFIDLPN